MNESTTHFVKNISVETVMDLESKGEAVVLAGETQAGKSSFIETAAESTSVMNLLATREAEGKGTTANTIISITDCEGIPEDKLVVTGRLEPKNLADISDDNETFGSILYSVAKFDDKNPNNPMLRREKCISALNHALKDASNESLPYMFRGSFESGSGELKDEFIDLLLALDSSKLNLIYNEAIEAKKKGQKTVAKFTNLVSNCEDFSEFIKKLWDLALKIVNNELNKFREEIKASGAYFYNDDTRFIVALGNEDIGSKLAVDLLKSEKGSKEYLISDLHLIFRGSDDYLNSNQFTVTQITAENGTTTNVHCIRLIDTKGLFHAPGVTIKSEAERIEDILSEYHSSKMIIIKNSFISDTSKDSAIALSTFLRDAGRNIDVAILFTHWDQYLESYGKHGMANKFIKPTTRIDWYQKFAEAERDQNELIEYFNQSVRENENKRKPCIIGVYQAAMINDSESTRDMVLDKHDFYYTTAMQKIFEDFAANDKKRGPKFKVKGSVIDAFSKSPADASGESQFFTIGKEGTLDISNLYMNLIECKDKKLYAATVRACVRKWCKIGNEHISDVASNDYGFMNIKTSFVTYIRNIGRNQMLNQTEFNVTYLLDDENPDFLNELKRFCSDTVGRKLAIILGDDAYRNGYCKTLNMSFPYLYKRFQSMLEYAHTKYFGKKQIDKNNLISAFEAALKSCIIEFIDTKCIVVY